MVKKSDTQARSQSGNVLFIILIAVALLGILTAVVQSGSNSESSNIDDESLSIKISQTQSYVAELERAVLYIMRQAVSESDIRFALPNDDSTDYGDIDAANGDGQTHIFQVFHRDGGAANYRLPETGISDGSTWEFVGMTHIPGIGTSRGDLVAVLPNVTDAFCARINAINGQTGAPTDTGACIYPSNNSARFDGGQQFEDSAPNTFDEATFEQDSSAGAVKPAPQACVVCTTGGANYFYHVLLAR